MNSTIALPLAALVALALAPAAAAQTCTFAIDPVQTQFTWSGTTSLGGITETPGNFSLAGSMQVDLAAAGDPASTGQLVGGAAAVTPNLAGFVPGPFGVHLVDISATGVSFSASSTVFEGSGGAFTAEIVLTANSGVFVLAPLVGATTTIDITGEPSAPVLVSGTVTNLGGVLRLEIPNLAAAFDLLDPVSGLSGTITLNGDIVATAPAVPLCDTQLFAEPAELSINFGGNQSFVVDAGPAFGGSLYFLLGSGNGTVPGLPGPPALPLNPDGYFTFTLLNPNTLIAGSLGFLDGNGKAGANLALAGGTVSPNLAGVTLHHAAVVFDAAFTPALGTNAESVTFLP